MESIGITSSPIFQELASETREFINAVDAIVLKILRDKGIEIDQAPTTIEVVNNQGSCWYSYVLPLDLSSEKIFDLNWEFAKYYESENLSDLKGSKGIIFMFEPTGVTNACSPPRPSPSF